MRSHSQNYSQKNDGKSTVAKHFREWFHANHGGKLPNMKQVSIQFDRILGQNRDGIWYGYQIKALPPQLLMDNDN